MNNVKRWRLSAYVLLAAGLSLVYATEARSQILFMSPEGELVKIYSPASAIGSDGKISKGVVSADASNDKGRTWHSWSAIKSWPTPNLFSDVVRRGDELLAFAYVNVDAGFLGTKVYWSSDEGQTWQGGNRLTSDTGRWAPESGRVLVTSSGRVILPVTQIIDGGEGSGANNIGTIYSDDGGRSWTRGTLFGPPKSLPDRPEGFSEPAAVELANGKIWMVFRSRYGKLWQALSSNDGASWGTPRPTTLVSPLSAVNAKRIPGTDAVIIFWNNVKPGTSTDWNTRPNLWFPRSPLVYAISKDNCRTWSEPVVVDPGTGVYATAVFSGKDMFVGYHGDGPVVYDISNVVAYDIPTILGIAEGKRK